ncbi:hypothetical protein CC85DRAFT_299386 [Cutaneotrichosporon oleaginosum]|uniref:Cytochrome b561 domain-containing protein n=1 Tax=Cutaneotrichosporon oleaginosum TaxID=879819 RepID=A0A0J0XXH3_9TREE|nr:uncharacterized protein CC85DRAFT_299386 [Cutaneotrichosporon oleaginosum]KLT45738.1 hypothetical protein CC85DRAFT_299386 [Cutaneotrichosporon oleaginosum]TXT04495.1 hypothetical protein COLE_07314 [Cutaneotrichosporon oleaginosum]
MRRAALLLLLLHAASAQYGYGPYDAPATTAASPKPTAAAAAAGDDDASYGIKISPRSAVVAHAVCGALATMLLLPVGVMAARAPRAFTGKRWWFPLHAGVQALAATFVLAAFGIAWARFTLHPVNTPHRKAAVAFFALVFAQALLGLCVHLFRKRGRRGPGNYAHWGLGLAVVAVGWTVAWLGLTTEWQYRGHGKPAFGWRVGWGVVMGLWILLYAAGLALLPRQLRRERAAAAEERDADVAPLQSPNKIS